MYMSYEPLYGVFILKINVSFVNFDDIYINLPF